MNTLLFASRVRVCALFLVFAFPSTLSAQFVSFDPVVSTFAGTGAKGLVNGPATTAKFGVVSDIKLDSKGNAFVVDAGNNCVRKITPAGVVSTFGNTTTLKNPYGLAIDKSDNLYVTDLNNRCIRKITPAGTISLYAGTVGSAGYVDGTKATARFYSPTTIEVDLQGNVYVVDMKLVNTSTQHFIRKVTADGAVSTLVGGTNGYVDAVGNKARFRDLQGICADTLGNLFVVDGGNNKIRKIRLADTLVTTFAGGDMHGYLDGILTSAKFNSPVDIAFDKVGNWFVTDYSNQVIRKISGNYVTTLAGTPDTAGFVNGAGTLSKFDYPLGIVSDSAGNLLVCDVTNNVIRKVSPQKLLSFSTITGTASVAQAVYVSGNNLDGSLLTVQAPQGYEVSLNGTNGFSSQVMLTGTNGTVVTTKIFLRLKGDAAQGVHNGEIKLVGSVALAQQTSVLSVTGTVSGPLGLENKRQNNVLHIYPNPATDHVMIETFTDWEATECQLFSVEGKLVYSTRLTLSSVQSVDVSNLPEGMYMLKLSNGKEHVCASFVKK